MKSKLVILGATGFIGKNLLEQLSTNNINFDIIVRNKDHVDKNIYGLNNVYQFDLSDLRNFDELNNIFKLNKYEKCIDLAWYCGNGYQTSIVNFDWIMITMLIAKAFAENGGKKFVFAGSVFEYCMTNTILSENKTKLDSHLYYGKAKTQCFNILQSYFEKNNIQFKNARIFNLFGKYEKSDRLIPYIIKNALLKNDIILNNNKTQDYSYVVDTCNSIYSILESDVVGAVNVCSGIPITIKTIAEKICDLTNCPYSKIHFKDTNTSDFICGNNTVLKNKVKYIYKYSIDSALIELIKFYEDNKI